jgi:hypothetical protein
VRINDKIIITTCSDTLMLCHEPSGHEQRGSGMSKVKNKVLRGQEGGVPLMSGWCSARVTPFHLINNLI